jgi:putative Mg2+ transporter-C (MgtC) family protein
MALFSEATLLLVLKLEFAVLAGVLLGITRQRKSSAGYRTFSLVTLGSTVFTLAFLDLGSDNIDPSRVAAQIVTGVGFIGAGLIWKHQGSLRGLTTAAGVWVSAALGIAIALGKWSLAAIGLALSLLILKLKDWVPEDEPRQYIEIGHERDSEEH